jgi:SET domain-containing protein
MIKNTPPYHIVVRDVKGKGRGVFALKNFKRGELIEICPALIIPAKQSANVMKSKLEHYAFDWDKDDIALILGYGMIYNHSYAPNARMVHDIGKKKSEIWAISAIKSGEEILVNYNGAPKDKSPLWFDVVDHRMGE